VRLDHLLSKEHLAGELARSVQTHARMFMPRWSSRVEH
jgi:hypothetical protein